MCKVALIALVLTFCLILTPAYAIEIKYAKLFSIDKQDSYYVLKDSEGRKLVLYKNEKPNVDADLFVKIPVKRVVILSTSMASYLDAIDCKDSIVGVVTTKNWYFEDIKRGIEDGRIIEIGRARSPDYEKILTLNPDIVFIHPAFAGSDVVKKFNSLGIPYAACDAWLEDNPLGRFEWVKFYAAFFDKEDKAIEYFDKVEKRVREIGDKVKNARKTKAVYALVLKGLSKIPGGQSYHAKLVEMSGGEYIFKDLKGSKYVTVNKEEFISRTMDADVYIAIYMGRPIESKEELIREIPELAKTKPFIEDRVYAMQPWFWQNIHKMDKIVEDLAAILHPELFPQHELTMFKKI